MRTEKNLAVRFDVSRWDVPVPVLAIVGPLVGLAYVIVLPFIGLVSLTVLGICRVGESLRATWRKVVHAAIIA